MDVLCRIPFESLLHASEIEHYFVPAYRELESHHPEWLEWDERVRPGGWRFTESIALGLLLRDILGFPVGINLEDDKLSGAWLMRHVARACDAPPRLNKHSVMAKVVKWRREIPKDPTDVRGPRMCAIIGWAIAAGMAGLNSPTAFPPGISKDVDGRIGRRVYDEFVRLGEQVYLPAWEGEKPVPVPKELSLPDLPPIPPLDSDAEDHILPAYSVFGHAGAGPGAVHDDDTIDGGSGFRTGGPDDFADDDDDDETFVPGRSSASRRRRRGQEYGGFSSRRKRRRY